MAKPKSVFDRPGLRRWVTVLDRGLMVVLVVVAFRLLFPQLQAATGLGGSPIALPGWSMTTLEGDTVSSLELEGRVAVVTFWATWCHTCRREMPILQRVAAETSDDEVVVLGLSIDAGPERVIRSFIEDGGYTFRIGRADNVQRTAFGGIRGVPTTFVLDRDGKVRHRVAGYFAGPALMSAVERLLAEGAPEAR